ncbi:MAG: LuxR C-terminal-related transcriptional regulator [Caldilineaceae bacterium]
MSMPILATKLYIPPPRPKSVLRPRLIKRLNEGLHRKLTLISAPAGFGKTTLVSTWVASCGRPVAWLSLDEGDNDPARFLAYFTVALQRVMPEIGKGVLSALQSPQPPAIAALLTALVNEITTVPGSFVLILDDYHLLDAGGPLGAIDQALTFLIEHLPPPMHLVIATREDPPLSLARLRVRDQLTEVRVADLRFTLAEATDFLNQVMGLNLTNEAIAALESRTEGWVAGLQLAALTLQGGLAQEHHTDSFLQSFTGSHRFVMDYLVEEVLQQQPANIQAFLLHTSLLNRLCGPLCDAVVRDQRLETGDHQSPVPSPRSLVSGLRSLVSGLRSQAILEYLEQANLFIVPLDNERRWYRYHHLFADLLRQRLHQSFPPHEENEKGGVKELHIRASQWYEDNGLEIEAFHHAAAANDIVRAERLIEGKGIPLHLRGAVTTILTWLESLPVSVLNERPTLWWRHASLLLVSGQTGGVEEKLQAAEDALQTTLSNREVDDKSRNLIGRIATARAVLALTRYQVEIMLTQSRRALEYLHKDNLSTRANANWILGIAYQFLGNRPAARQAQTEAIALSRAAGDIFTTILATIGLGNIQEAENQLQLAVETYQRVLQLAGDQPLQIICEAHLGLARIFYEWNDLTAAESHARQSLHYARQYDRVIDRFIICEVFLARLQLAQGDLAGASAMLDKTEQAARQQNFVHRLSEVAAAQVFVLLRQGNLANAAHLAQTYKLSLSQVRVYLAQGDPSAALAVLAPFRQELEAKGWADERLKALVLEALAHQVQGTQARALHLLADALALAEPGGFIRLFVDEGLLMAQLLSAASAEGIAPAYTGRLLAAFPTMTAVSTPQSKIQNADLGRTKSQMVEPLSQRELGVLQLIAQGLSNQEISGRLFLALSTVKGHNRIIFDKLQVKSRTEAVARARELELL